MADVVGLRATIVPTTAQPIATFEDGSCAAALNTIGKGHVLLWGIQRTTDQMGVLRRDGPAGRPRAAPPNHRRQGARMGRVSMREAPASSRMTSRTGSHRILRPL